MGSTRIRVALRLQQNFITNGNTRLRNLNLTSLFPGALFLT